MFYFRSKGLKRYVKGEGVAWIESQVITPEVWKDAQQKGNGIICIKRGDDDFVITTRDTKFEEFEQEEKGWKDKDEDLEFKKKQLELAIEYRVRKCPICEKPGSIQFRCSASRYRCPDDHYWWASTGEIITDKEMEARDEEDFRKASILQVNLFLERASKMLNEPFIQCERIRKPKKMKSFLRRTMTTLKALSLESVFLDFLKIAKKECEQLLRNE